MGMDGWDRRDGMIVVYDPSVTDQDRQRVDDARRSVKRWGAVAHGGDATMRGGAVVAAFVLLAFAIVVVSGLISGLISGGPAEVWSTLRDRWLVAACLLGPPVLAAAGGAATRTVARRRQASARTSAPAVRSVTLSTWDPAGQAVVDATGPASRAVTAASGEYGCGVDVSSVRDATQSSLWTVAQVAHHQPPKWRKTVERLTGDLTDLAARCEARAAELALPPDLDGVATRTSDARLLLEAMPAPPPGPSGVSPVDRPTPTPTWTSTTEVIRLGQRSYAWMCRACGTIRKGYPTLRDARGMRDEHMHTTGHLLTQNARDLSILPTRYRDYR